MITYKITVNTEEQTPNDFHLLSCALLIEALLDPYGGVSTLAIFTSHLRYCVAVWSVQWVSSSIIFISILVDSLSSNTITRPMSPWSRISLCSHPRAHRRTLLLENLAHATKCQVRSRVSSRSVWYFQSSTPSLIHREDRAGVRFRLQVVVMDVHTCAPIANAAVTIWHCDAMGIYSHFVQASQNQPNAHTDNSTFLRGIQLTNVSGVATFDTIYPGWYNGRTIHIHVKVHLGGRYLNASSYYSGATYVHTGQLFFNDSLSDLVVATSPYNSKTGNRLLNSRDGIYSSGGAATLMNVQYVKSGGGLSKGLVTSVILGVSAPTSTTTTAKTRKTTTKKTTTKKT